MSSHKKQSTFSVYVVLLDSAALKRKSFVRENPHHDDAKPCVYVGMTGLTVEERFNNHKRGYKAARIVTEFGLRSMPHLYEHLNPMTRDEAERMEQKLAADLRAEGYTVAGGTAQKRKPRVSLQQVAHRRYNGHPKSAAIHKPYVNKSTKELADMSETTWSDVANLEMIYAELRFRNNSKATQLRDHIRERLAQISPESLTWPDTAILARLQALSQDQYWYKQGLLSFMGYRAANREISGEQRRKLLDYVFHKDIPRVRDATYMREWDQPQTAERLKKLAGNLAAFANAAANKRSVDMSRPIEAWQEDLQYLKRSYCDRQFNDVFSWPPKIEPSLPVNNTITSAKLVWKTSILTEISPRDG